MSEDAKFGVDEVETVSNWLHWQPTEFYKARIHTLIRRLNTAIERGDDYVEK